MIPRRYVSAKGKRRTRSAITFPLALDVLRWVSEQLAGVAVAAEATEALEALGAAIVRADELWAP